MEKIIEGHGVSEAARQVGYSRHGASHWLNSPEGQEMVEHALAQVAAILATNMPRLVETACEALEKQLNQPFGRLQAVEAVLNLADRLESLRAAHAAREGEEKQI